MIPDLFNIENKVVIITGGLGQLGRQFTRGLVLYGANVIILDILPSNNNYYLHLTDELGSSHLDYYQVDITNKESIDIVSKNIIRKWDCPSGLINTAAIDAPPNASLENAGPLELYSEAAWDKMLEVNVKGTFLCCQIFGSEMAKKNRGSIINISSIYGMVSPDQRIYQYRRKKGEQFYKPVAYSVSKSAIYNLTRYLATYWGEQNVRVNTITFGGVFNNQDKEFLQEYCIRVPLGRMASENEYTGAIVFLLSDASSYMTGSNMIIDGGWTAW